MLVLLVAAGCSSGSSGGSDGSAADAAGDDGGVVDTADAPAAVGAVDEGDGTAFVTRPTLTFVVNDWTASALNVAVAEQLIERHLGYPVVPMRMDDTDEIYEGLAEGSIDAMLEIWPNSMSDRDRLYFDRDQVLDVGPLGSVGKVGWFVPRYVIDDDPALATWEGYDRPGVAARFATEATAPLGRFLGTNPDYAQFDADIIANLGLPFEVEFSGSEQATETELARRVAAGDPVLVYWWAPTAAVARHDLVNVTLPERTEACATAAAARSSAVDCDYPSDEIFKAASVELPSKAPDVMSFLQRFTLTTEDQMAMLVAVEVDGRSIQGAAAEWIATNAETWEPWLTDE
ncbi:MAG: glycine betaine ABC transporter substrate-binding protein [Actinomycetota bacterium]